MFWFTAAFVVGAAADITRLLFAGDWDFWTDWKDRQWGMTITPFAMIIIPSALQYIQWLPPAFPPPSTHTSVRPRGEGWSRPGLARARVVKGPPNFQWPATTQP